VLSFNAGGNAGSDDAAPLLRMVQAVDADIVAFQELSPAILGTIRRELAASYPYSAGTSSAVVFSRFPLGGADTLSFVDRGSDAQRVEVAIGEQHVTLFNVHVTRPGYHLRGRRGLLLLAHEYDPTVRDAHAAEIAAQVRRTEGPRIVAGDLNGSQWSRPYRLLSAELQDSFPEGGAAFGHTYPSSLQWGPWRLSLPLVRIDYIFHSAELVALATRVGPDGGSDHLPVVAELAFR
jgi:endonuclease/exonuclease/phosphatase (EEP) superfamily protein YafD